MFRIVNADSRQTVLSPVVKALEEGVIVGLANHTILISKDGSELPIDDSGAPIRTTEEEIVGCVRVFRDVTEQKRMENELQQRASNLSESDHRKDEFLATLAHELRNPLAAIRNGLELMKVAGGEVEVVEQVRFMMERQLTQMVRLVDDLMDVSRISRCKLELRKERISLAEVLNSAVETSRPLIDEMGHKLTVSLPEQPILIDGDMTRLAQVFLNLLKNAAKYSD